MGKILNENMTYLKSSYFLTQTFLQNVFSILLQIIMSTQTRKF